MLRAEITIFRDKSDPVHYLEHRAKDIISILWKNDVDVTKVTFQEKDKGKKRLWKYKLTYYSKPLYGPSLLQEELSNIRELTTDEAINWLDESIKLTHRDYNFVGLYYKKDGEWVLYDRSCIKH